MLRKLKLIKLRNASLNTAKTFVYKYGEDYEFWLDFSQDFKI